MKCECNRLHSVGRCGRGVCAVKSRAEDVEVSSGKYDRVSVRRPGLFTKASGGVYTRKWKIRRDEVDYPKEYFVELITKGRLMRKAVKCVGRCEFSGQRRKRVEWWTCPWWLVNSE